MRLGFQNDEYAVFFRAAGSSERPGEPGEVDIHTGDRILGNRREPRMDMGAAA
jgi:hypothetical protein